MTTKCNECTFAVQDQVIVRRPILHGRGSQLIKLGTILSFADKDHQRAVVTFEADRTRATIPVAQLEPVKARYARSRVNVDPTRRSISYLR